MNSVIVGRGNGSHLMLSHSSVSRQHCRFDLGPKGMRLTDLSSPNGTFLGGTRIQPLHPVDVPPGAVVMVGNGIRVDLARVYQLLTSKGGRAIVAPPRRAEPSGYPISTPGMDVRASNSAGVQGVHVYNQQQQGASSAEIITALEYQKSYVGKAWIAFLLYWVGFYIIGLIFNIVWLSESSNTKKIAGKSDGHGCLVTLLIVFLVGPALGYLILLILGLSPLALL